MKKKIVFTLAFLSLLALPLRFVQAEGSKDKKAPKCEKCYRGPDGKIKCDPVPCPVKK
ncbi:MAG: hypothetical protein HQM15_08440 [Deltaproteobacteria bacterium]|nr:hypothetical protein [Deltaproteobacteria bacterium]